MSKRNPMTKISDPRVSNGWRHTNASTSLRDCNFRKIHTAGKYGPNWNMKQPTTTNSSTLVDNDNHGQTRGRCHCSGLKTAYGAQFMYGSCHTMKVVMAAIITIGLAGLRRQAMMQTISRAGTEKMVKI